MPHGESPTDDHPRLLLALRDAAPGALFFVQLNSPVQRRRLPEKLAADGLKRPFAVADFATFQPGPPPDGVLREFLEEVKSTPPEILFVDGLEHWVEADPKTLDALNLGRERLTNLGVVIVFLLPAYLIDLIRTRALNLWSWRAHHYSLELSDAATGGEAAILSLDTDRPIAPGDTPEARDRRIRILQRLLAEGLAEQRTIESLTHPILLPLVQELYDAGRFAEALTELDRVTDSLEKAEDSADKAFLLNWRGIILQALGRSHESEPLLQRALAIREKILGAEHLNVATSLSNLAVLYGSQGQYARAEPLLQRALAIMEKEVGPEHPDIALSLNNLAVLYGSQGQYARAEPLLQRALAITEKVLGPEHPDVATVLENYAPLLRQTNREAEAAKMEARAEAIRAKHARENPTDRNV